MFYLLTKYWPQMPRALVGGYTKPDFNIDADWYSIGDFADYPVDRWSDGLIEFLSHVDDEIILFMMDDYWLNAPVDHERITALNDYLQTHAQIARLDLTYDRLMNSNWTDIETLWDISGLILSNPSPYYFSYQAALWRRSFFVKAIERHETPWESELAGSERLYVTSGHVLGTKQPPLRYTIAVQAGKLTLDGGYQPVGYGLQDEDADYILKQNWIPGQMLNEAQHA